MGCPRLPTVFMVRFSDRPVHGVCGGGRYGSGVARSIGSAEGPRTLRSMCHAICRSAGRFLRAARSTSRFCERCVSLDQLAPSATLQADAVSLRWKENMIKRFVLALLPLALSGNAMAHGSVLLAPEGCESGLYREIRKDTIECVDRIDLDLVNRLCALPSPGVAPLMLACSPPEKAGK